MRYFTLLILILFVLPVSAQERATIPTLKKAREKRKAAAKQNIVKLKDGILLVRLDFDKRKVAYYEKYNNTSEARKVREKALKVNTEIIDAFNTYYTFSKVYYFAMDDSRKILDGKLDEVVFYDSTGAEDPSIKVSDAEYFIAEFTYIEQDTTTYYSGSTPSTNSTTDPEGTTYYGGSKNNRSALVIRDKNFLQLRDPFPYFSTYKHFGLVKTRYRAPVRKLEEKLVRYFGTVAGAVVQE